MVAEQKKNSNAGLDWANLEGLFCQMVMAPPGGMPLGSASPKLGRDAAAGSDSEKKKFRESHEINLLDGKRSLNINIFLKQFRR
jgi:hypothetical protein